jgi:hypothetical protein
VWTLPVSGFQACPDLQEVTIRWRGSFGYLIAWAGEATMTSRSL